MAGTPKKLMKEAAVSLQEIMTEHLTEISAEMVRQFMARWRAGKESVAEVKWPGEMSYYDDIKTALTLLATDAINSARKEVPAAKNIKLGHVEEGIQFAATTVIFSALPTEVQNYIIKQTQLLVGSHLGDLEKNLKFQYADSFGTTDSEGTMEDDLSNVCVEFIEGNSVRAGANLLSSKTVNESRSAFFMDDDVLEELDAFEFVNGDPVTPVCQDLAGTIFAKDDPNMFRYTPPLHWNCKSYIQPILKGKLGKRDIDRLKPSTKKLEDSIQFSDAGLGCNCGSCS